MVSSTETPGSGDIRDNRIRICIIIHLLCCMIQILPELKTETTNKNMTEESLKKLFPTYSPHDVLQLNFICQNIQPGTSLEVQWFGVCLSAWGTAVRSLLGELRSHMLQGIQAHAPQLLSLITSTRTKPAHHKETSHVPQDPMQPKINK